MKPEERASLVVRVLASPHFRKSARLTEFLTYVVDRAVANPEVPIRETEIAARVFGRDPRDGEDDTIVRVHASKLRKRLEQYFQTDGAAETLIIEVPKGNYAPVFLKRPPVSVPPPAVPPRRAPAPFALAALLLLGAVLWLGWDNLRLRNASPEMSANLGQFWNPFLKSTLTNVVVLSDSGIGLFQELGHVDVSAAQYANRDYEPVLRSVPALRSL